MNNIDNSTSSGGIGFCGLLTIVFIILKLCNVITWSWIWVFAPLWGSFLLSIIFLMLIYIIADNINN